MNDLQLMRSLEPIQDLPHDAHAPVDRQCTRTRYQQFQGFAFHVLHRNEFLAILFIEIVDTADIRMGDLPGQQDFALWNHGAGKELLHRNRVATNPISRLEYGPGCPTSEFSTYLKASHVRLTRKEMSEIAGNCRALYRILRLKKSILHELLLHSQLLDAVPLGPKSFLVGQETVSEGTQVK